MLREFPDFRLAWDEHVAWWGNKTPGLCNDLAAFSHYVIEILPDVAGEHRSKIFEFAERLMAEGDQEVQNAAATCFLENIAHRVENGDLSPFVFGPFLGEESRHYLRAYDEFMGGKTLGV